MRYETWWSMGLMIALALGCGQKTEQQAQTPAAKETTTAARKETAARPAAPSASNGDIWRIKQ